MRNVDFLHCATLQERQAAFVSGPQRREERGVLAGRTLSAAVSLGVQTLNPQHLVTENTNQLTTMDINSKSEFIYFMQRACEDQSNDCYIELYNILLRCSFL